MKIYKNPPKYTHEFEPGIGYEGTILIDNGWEKVSLSAYDEKEGLIDCQETKWVKQNSFFSEKKIIKNIAKAEKRIHRALENHYKKKIFYCSITNT
jgi:hypothetical protein